MAPKDLSVSSANWNVVGGVSGVCVGGIHGVLPSSCRVVGNIVYLVVVHGTCASHDDAGSSVVCGNVGHEVIASNVHNVLRWAQDGAAKARVGEGSVVEHVIDELQQEEEEEGHATMLAPCRDCATHTLTNCCPSAQVRLVFSFLPPPAGCSPPPFHGE